MSNPGAILGWSVTALAAAGVIYTLAAAILVRRRPGPPAAQTSLPPGVTLLKPLYQGEVGLEDNLRSFLEQDYEGEIQVVFGVHSRSDPALAIAERLRENHPDRDLAIVVNPNIVGVNPKIANLCNMIGHARHDVLVLSDSDIRVPPDYVRTLACELSQQNVGAVTCLYRGKPLGGLWSILEAMHIDFAFLPNVVFGTAVGLARPCFGSTIALSRRVLGEIGGFGSLAHQLADDYEIGRSVRRKGYTVALSSVVVDHACTERSFRDLVHHELRWAKTVRILNGPGHIGSVVTHPLALALLAVLLQGLAFPGAIVLVAALLSRLWLAWRVCLMTKSQPGSLWLLPLRDMLSFGIFLGSFFGNSVYWRGTRYLTDSDGILAQQ